MKISYADKTTPKEYFCAQCHATNCKLWREYQTFSPQLLCVDCTIKDQSRPNISSLEREAHIHVDDNGRWESQIGKTDQLGFYVPAVPCEDGYGYWGYGAVPNEGVVWWRQLPTRPPPWDKFDSYAGGYVCNYCGASAGWRTHNPGCKRMTLPEKMTWWKRDAKSWWRKLVERVA